MKFNFYRVMFLGVAALAVSSCDQLKELSYSTTPNPLEMHGDSVAISVTVNIPPKGINKKVSVEVTPVLGDAKLTTWKIQGEKATGNGQSINFKPGGTATFTDIVAYNASMEAADLTLTGKVFKGTKENTKEALPVTKLADATIITPMLVQPTFKMLTETATIPRSFEKTATAEVNYLKGKSDVRAAEMKDKDVTDLVAWIQAAQSNPKIKINGIDIQGYASPDGEETFNNNLSGTRSKAARKAFMDLMKKNNLMMFSDSSSYVTAGLGEDFEGFKVELERTAAILQADKDLFLRVLTMSNDPKQRENDLVALGKGFTQLEKEVFPKIRRAVIVVNYTEQGLSDEELRAKASTSPSEMTADELIFTASTLVKDLNEQGKIYDAAALAYPTDVRALNNAGAVAYMQGNVSKAKMNLEKALNAKDNSKSKNNLAGVAMSQGDRATAKKMLSQVKDKSAETSYNNAIISILEGKYSTAITSCGSEASFNKALASVLNGNLDEASKTLAASKDKESADGYYLKAIIAARSNAGVDAVVSNLKSAISKDKKYKEKASKDREFIKFMNDGSFTAALN
jgi:tetratricopeptide (TPR) repeat protein/outer membrane protein OmpA-like peptidoglycan-associated protein